MRVRELKYLLDKVDPDLKILVRTTCSCGTDEDTISSVYVSKQLLEKDSQEMYLIIEPLW